MRQYRDKVLAAFWGHCRGSARTLLTVLALAGLAAWTAQGYGPHARQQGPRGATGEILSAIHGRCLSYYPASAASAAYPGAPASGLIAGLNVCSLTGQHIWRLPGDNTIRNAGKCLTALHKNSGTGVVLATCSGSPRQFWEADGIAGGAGTEVLNPWSGRCMTDPNGSTANNTPVRLYRCNRSAADQTWFLPPSKPR